MNETNSVTPEKPKASLNEEEALTDMRGDLKDEVELSNGANEEDEAAVSNPIVSQTNDNDIGDMEGDRIGDTCYSKRSILNILMRILDECPKYTLQQISMDEACSEEDATTKDLKEELEETMSLLWDISTEKEVSMFLMENNFVDIVNTALESRVCDRLSEGLTGIVTNFLSHSSCANQFYKHSKSLQTFYAVLELMQDSTSTEVLMQCFKFVKSVVWHISNSNWISKYYVVLLEESFCGLSRFVLESSTNVDLLTSALQCWIEILQVSSGNDPDSSAVDTLNSKFPQAASIHNAAIEALREIVKSCDCDSSDVLSKKLEPISSGIKVLLGCKNSVNFIDLSNSQAERTPREHIGGDNYSGLNASLCIFEVFFLRPEYEGLPIFNSSSDLLSLYADLLELMQCYQTELKELKEDAISKPLISVFSLFKHVEKNAEHYNPETTDFSLVWTIESTQDKNKLYNVEATGDLYEAIASMMDQYIREAKLIFPKQFDKLFDTNKQVNDCYLKLTKIKNEYTSTAPESL